MTQSQIVPPWSVISSVANLNGGPFSDRMARRKKAEEIRIRAVNYLERNGDSTTESITYGISNRGLSMSIVECGKRLAQYSEVEKKEPYNHHAVWGLK